MLFLPWIGCQTVVGSSWGGQGGTWGSQGGTQVGIGHLECNSDYALLE